MLEEDSSDVYGNGDDGGSGIFPGNRGEGSGSYRDEGVEARQTMVLGRTGEVEGQMEVGGRGNRWDDDDSDSDSGGGSGAGARSGLVEPA